jgi:outer membrane protein assembly factor BamB
MKNLHWLAVLSTALSLPALAETPPANWPQWRGPLLTGASPDAAPPTKWSETENIKWKVKIPGRGSSTPVIWGDTVYLTTAIPAAPTPPPTSATPAAPPSEKPAALAPATPAPAAATPAAPSAPDAAAPTPPNATPPATPPAGGPGRPRRGPGGGGFPGGPGGPGGGRSGFGGGGAPTTKEQFVLLALDRATGAVRWQKTAREVVPHEGHQQDNTFASNSPVTDGEHVYAFFGSRGLYCYDLKGELKWEKDFGKMTTRAGFGEGASPALFGDTLIVNWDHEGDDFIVALNKKTGDEIWRQKRDEHTSWTTPLVLEHEGKAQVIVTGANKSRSYDLKTGAQLWELGGMTTNVIPTPVGGFDMVYLISGFRGAALQAVKLGSSGTLDGTPAVAWQHNKGTPYVPSPLLAGERLYFFSGNTNVLSCFNAKTGAPLFEGTRVPDLRDIYASPVAAADRVYLLGRDGKTVVLKQDDKMEVLATNKLDEKTDASPAIVGKEIFLRGQNSLYCIAEPVK